MNLDDHICYCFRVTRRKLVNFTRLNHPLVPSQLSQCGGAGTGCGWCIPFLTQIFQQSAADAEFELESLSADEYARRRACYIRAGGGVAPPSALPLPQADETAHQNVPQ